MNPTKRRQLSIRLDFPTTFPKEFIEFCEDAAECEFWGSREQYAEAVTKANLTLPRFERGFFAGFLAARRSERP